MALSRRAFLRLLALTSAGTGLSACAPITSALLANPPVAAGETAAPRAIAGALARLTFGARLEELQRALEIGLRGWIEEQLAYPEIEDVALSLRLRNHEAPRAQARDLERRDKREVMEEMRSASLLRMVYSRRQLYETIVSFWTDHFNIFIEKGACWLLKPADDREVIRRHALGNFRDLLLASAHSPAMLVYLDNQANAKEAPNENYAREVMELHSLGVEGGYTQKDVMELARCLTGWTVKEHFWRGQFTFDPDLHAPGAKAVLGMHIPEKGEGEAQEVLERLAGHPSTAHHLAVKLVRRFISDDPATEPELVERVERTFLQTSGDLQAVFRTLLLDGLAARASLPPKIKRPLEYVVSALRQTGAETDGGGPLQEALARMGQPLFGWPTPDGPPDHAQPWQGALMPRWQFAFDLAHGAIRGTKLDQRWMGAGGPREALRRASVALFGAPPAHALARAIDEATGDGSLEEGEAAALVLASLIASPAYQWR